MDRQTKHHLVPLSHLDHYSNRQFSFISQQPVQFFEEGFSNSLFARALNRVFDTCQVRRRSIFQSQLIQPCCSEDQASAVAEHSFPPTPIYQMARLLAAVAAIAIVSLIFGDFAETSPEKFDDLLRSPDESLCVQLILPAGYSCSENTIQTKDGYLLALQRVSSSCPDNAGERGPPVLLQHGLFMAGDAWFLNTPEQSLGFILVDHGFDVWVGNVRGTRWSYGHKYLSEKDKEFWDWSWQELALYDLAEMIDYIHSVTNSKLFVVGHSQGTIMSLAAFTQTQIVEKVEAAALLSPISYLGHVDAPFVLRMVNMHIDQMILAMGIHQLNLRSGWGVSLLDSICDGHVNCNDLLTSITGKNCCFNNSRVDFYLQYEPHPSSSKNLHHLFQMIRKGSFSKYDYGILKNLIEYGQLKPPEFNLGSIPKLLPLWMAYGGNDALADMTDFLHTVKELPSTPELLYLEDYGHVDFILSSNAKEDIYDHMIRFFKSMGNSSSFSSILPQSMVDVNSELIA